MQHIHFHSHEAIIHAASRIISEKYVASLGIEKKHTITVYGIEPRTSKIDIEDRVISIAAKEIYVAAHPDSDTSLANSLQCKGCRQFFINQIRLNRLEIELRVMELVRLKNLFCSCEHIEYDHWKKSINVSFRQNASIATQRVIHFAPVYLDSYDKLCEVQQREYAITTASSAKPVLATWHLSDCIAVVGFEKQQRIGFLFHVDYGSKLANAISALVKTLFKKLNNEKYIFDFILIGSSNSDEYTTEQRLESIEHDFTKHSTDSCSFHRKYCRRDIQLVFNDLCADSFWSKAMRLHRSVALDCRYNDPLSNLMAYEAELNPESAFHKRNYSEEEIEQYCSVREFNCAFEDL